MALVIRMKNVTRSLLFLGSLVVWVVALSIFNVELDMEEYLILAAAVFIALVQTWVLVVALHT